MQLAARPHGPSIESAVRIDELGRIPLVHFAYEPQRGSGKGPWDLVASAMPAFTADVIEDARNSDWTEFWQRHPAGEPRMVRLAATSWNDAVKAAGVIARTTRPERADGDKQAQAVLQLADGSWYAASLGGIDDARQSAWLLRMGGFTGYYKPTATALVPELQAVVGGASLVDLRGRFGVPVQT